MQPAKSPFPKSLFASEELTISLGCTSCEPTWREKARFVAKMGPEAWEGVSATIEAKSCCRPVAKVLAYGHEPKITSGGGLYGGYDVLRK